MSDSKVDTTKHDIHNPFYSPEVKDPIDADWQAKRRVANALRTMINDLVTCTSDAATLNDIADQLTGLSGKMREAPKILGRTAYLDVEGGKHGSMASLGYELNPMDGESNPIAAPMKLWIDEEEDVAYGRVNMGWQYEGPPNSVHGGFVAAILDQFLGVAQKITHQPGVTGTLKIRYIKPTPLNTDLKLVGRVKSVQGRKNVLVGEIWAGDVLTATAEGLFIHIDLAAYEEMKARVPQ